MGYDPTQAGDPIPRKFKNVMRCMVNEIITMAEAVSRGRYFKGLPEGVAEGEPYWDFYFQALDAKWARDGSWLDWKAAGRLFTKEGKRQDNTAKPYRVSTGFAGLTPPISVFPGDPDGRFDGFCESVHDEPLGGNPNYDASKVVGRVFHCVIEEVEFGTDMPLPITAEPEGYIYTDKIRELGSSTGGSDMNLDGTVAPVASAPADILADGGAEGLKQVLAVLDGKPAEGDGLFDMLQAGGVGSNLTIDGESVIGAALSDTLAGKLQEAGKITITDGKIGVTA